MAKHRARYAARRGTPRVAIPVQRGPRLVGITDARTEIEHLVTDDVIARHRHSGRYLAACGALVLAASLVAAPRGRCGPCMITVVGR